MDPNYSNALPVLRLLQDLGYVPPRSRRSYAPRSACP